MDIKRQAFIKHHQDWIVFLNTMGKIKDTVNKITETNNGTISFDPDGIKFNSEKDFVIACYYFMYENLKSLSRGLTTELQEYHDFGLKEAEALINSIAIRLDRKPNREKNYIYYDYSFGLRSVVPELVLYMHRYLEYINWLAKGLRGKATLGVYKIGVCPYKRLNDKEECGVVFVGKKWDQAACENHHSKWQCLKNKHSKRSKPIEKYL